MESLFDVETPTEAESESMARDMEMLTPQTPLASREEKISAPKFRKRLVIASLLVGAAVGAFFWLPRRAAPAGSMDSEAVQLESEMKQPKTEVRVISEGVINGNAPPNALPKVELEADEMEVGLPRESCSRIGESCAKTKCCRFSGYLCYEKNSTWASCLKKCTPGESNGFLSKDEHVTNKPHVQPITRPGDKAEIKSNIPFFRAIEPGPWTCNRPRSLIPVVKAMPSPGTKLYCFTVMLTDNGSPKRQQTDFSLVRTQLHTRTSIFGCESWAVFSDVSTWLSPKSDGEQQQFTVQVDFPKNARRPNSRAWVNTPVYVNVWKAVKAQGKFRESDWVVKIDPGAVFFPARLREILSHQKVTDNGVFLENCKYVRYGFFGALEVMDNKAATVLTDKVEACFTELPWQHAQHAHGRFYGEDKFVQKCMERYNVNKVPSQYEAGEVPSDDPYKGLLTTNACPAHKTKTDTMKEKALKKPGTKIKWFPNCATTKTAAVHIFIKPEDYFECLKQSPLNTNFSKPK